MSSNTHFCLICGKVPDSRQHGISFHKFPKNKEDTWLELFSITKESLRVKVESAELCSRHFTPDSFIVAKNGSKRLIKGCVPTKCLIDNNDILHISNLDDRCLRCLCKAATKCNLTLGCEQGYCGPFKVSRVYWKDAGSPILPDDDIERAGAFEDCALSYHCAIKMVKGYIAKFGRDCNGDGITNCHDYSMINFNGGYQCHPALDRNDPGKAWLERFESCI